MAEIPTKDERSLPQNPVDSPSSQPGSVFFLITLSLGLAGWFLSLIAQSIVTHDIGNGPVGVMWFAIVLQTILLALLAMSLKSHTLPLQAYPITIFASMTTVLASIGINANVFSPNTQAQKAMAAGWLVTAIIDMLWILYLSSHPYSPIRRFFDALGPRTTYEPPLMSIPTVASNVDAFAYPPTGTRPTSNGASNRSGPRVASTTSAGAAAAGVATTNNNGNVNNNDPEAQKRRSAGVWNVYTPPQGDQERRTITSIPDEQTSSHGGAGGGGGPGGGAGAGARVSAGATTTLSGKGAGATGRTESVTSGQGAVLGRDSDVVYEKAQALFDYKASDSDPNEIPLNKSEIMDILDRTGKWWEVRKADGTKGIAPSNYLRLL